MEREIHQTFPSSYLFTPSSLPIILFKN